MISSLTSFHALEERMKNKGGRRAISGKLYPVVLQNFYLPHGVNSCRSTSMRNLVASFFIALLSLHLPCSGANYPERSERIRTKGNTTHYINPEKGDDNNSGTSPAQAWKSMIPANRLIMTRGDTLIISPGEHTASLALMGEGTKQSPITIRFLPGKHIFKHGNLISGKPQISNTNDAPNEPKAMAIRLTNTKNVRLEGKAGASDILLEGKAIFVCMEQADNVSLNGLNFDYLHPTMGEFLVTEVNGNTMNATIPDGILYKVQHGALTWYGPGWEFRMGGYAKVFDSATGTFQGNFNPAKTTIKELSPGKISITFNEGTPSMKPGQSYQNRNTRRDCCGFFQYRSKNIVWNNCHIYYMHGMGVVSQFSENIMFNHLEIAPRANSLRTNSSWADNLHFSGCKGKIIVKDCLLGASHDDAINVHGTHLRIIGQPSSNQLIVRFMHPQTFGFDAFAVGDQINYVSYNTLIPYAANTITAIKQLNGKEIELTLKNPNPKDIQPNDAVENVTWTPSVHVSNTVCRHIPTRGFLLTTRKPVLIEQCRFEKTGMPAILVEDDASGWYESGIVRDMTISRNTFIQCGEAVIQIVPHAPHPNGEVHKNITITGNSFDLKNGTAIRTRHTGNVKAEKNTFSKNGKNFPEEKAVDIR